MITVALADHYHLVRQGIRCLLERERDLEIVGEVADGLKVIDLVKRRKPRVLVVSLGMPGLNGFEITRRVREHAPKTGVIVLSMYGHDQYVIEALRRGASGYVVTQTNGTELIRAVRTVAAGRHYVSAPSGASCGFQDATYRAPGRWPRIVGRSGRIADVCAPWRRDVGGGGRRVQPRRSAAPISSRQHARRDELGPWNYRRRGTRGGLCATQSLRSNDPRA